MTSHVGLTCCETARDDPPVKAPNAIPARLERTAWVWESCAAPFLLLLQGRYLAVTLQALAGVIRLQQLWRAVHEHGSIEAAQSHEMFQSETHGYWLV